MGAVVEFKPMDLSAKIKRDLAENKQYKKNIESYWSSLGHKVEVEVRYDPVYKIHTLHSADLENGRPKERLTPVCRAKLFKFS